MKTFEQIQHDKTNELTDRIMAKIGELFLKSQIGAPGDSAFGFITSTDPRSEIRDVIYWWMTEEREEKEDG